MQHLCASSQVLQTKDLRVKLNSLDATLTQNRGTLYKPKFSSFPISHLPRPILELATRHCPVASVTIGIQCAGDHEVTVWRWRPKGVGEEGEGGGAAAAGGVDDDEVAGAALWRRAVFRRSGMGLQDFRAGRRNGAAQLGGGSNRAAGGRG